MPSSDPLFSTYRTYIDWDYSKNFCDGTIGGKYGPHSHHYCVVNHGMADDSVRKDFDVVAYMFMTTRDGGDPFWVPND